MRILIYGTFIYFELSDFQHTSYLRETFTAIHNNKSLHFTCMYNIRKYFRRSSIKSPSVDESEQRHSAKSREDSKDKDRQSSRDKHRDDKERSSSHRSSRSKDSDKDQSKDKDKDKVGSVFFFNFRLYLKCSRLEVGDGTKRSDC